jgi:hypothetical protein
MGLTKRVWFHRHFITGGPLWRQLAGRMLMIRSRFCAALMILSSWMSVGFSGSMITAVCDSECGPLHVAVQYGIAAEGERDEQFRKAAPG